MKVLRGVVDRLRSLLPRKRDGKSGAKLDASFSASPTHSGLISDSPAKGGPLTVSVSPNINKGALKQARDAAFDACDRAFRGMTVHPERKLLMKRPHDITSVLSANDVSFKHLRAELILEDCVFRKMAWSHLMSKLRSIEKTVSREAIESNRIYIKQLFLRYIARPTCTSESELVQKHSNFMCRTSAALTNQDVDRDINVELNKQSAAIGPLSKRDGNSNKVDTKAGFRGKTDYKLRFGDPSKGNRTLLVVEAKYHKERPNMARPWWEIQSNHLPELMESMIGQLALLGVAVNNFGMKVHLIDTPEGAGSSTFFCSPPGPLYLDFSKPEELEMAFEFWLEAAALAVPPPSKGGTKPAEAVAVSTRPAANPHNTTEAKLSHAKASRKRSKPDTGAHPGTPKKQTRSIWTVTSEGERLDFTSLDLSEGLTEEEQVLLDAQFEKERSEMEMEMDGVDADDKGKYYDASTHEPSTPWFN